jgi:hypothetical protein
VSTGPSTRIGTVRRGAATARRLSERVLRLAGRGIVAGLRRVYRPRHLRWILLAGLAIRLLLVPYSADTDLETFAEGSLSTVFGAGLYTNPIIYPPGWVLLLSLFGRTAALFEPGYRIVTLLPTLVSIDTQLGTNILPPGLASPIFAIVEKVPLIAFDVLTGYVLYLFAQELGADKSRARFAFALWFLNPLVLIDSSVHGAYDVLPSFFTLAAIFLLLRRVPGSAGAAYGLGIALKLWPIFLLPLFVALLWRTETHHRPRALALFAAAAAGVIALTFWPPGLLGTYLTVVTTGPSVGESFGGLWVWSLTSLPGAGGFRAFLSSHTAIVLFATTAGAVAAILYLAFRFLRPSPTEEAFPRQLVGSFILGLLAIYTTLAIVQPQYLIWILPFLVLYGAAFGRFVRSMAWISVFASLFVTVGLGGPLFLFQPLVFFAGAIPLSDDIVSLRTGILASQYVIPLTTVLTFLALLLTGYRLVRGPRLARRGVTA